MKKRKYSDENYHFYPFTWSVSGETNKLFGAGLRSGTDEYPGCYFYLNFGQYHLICELPQIIKPHKKWFAFDGGGYWDEKEVSYSFSLGDDYLYLCYGPQTHDSDTTKSKVFFLPWRQHRFVRESWYSEEGELMRTDYAKDKIPFHSKYAYEQSIPKAIFEVEDHDGELIKANVHIHEREWKIGTGVFKYLFWFKKPTIVREIEIEFEKEVGPEKGTWKGGLTGLGFYMEPDETVEGAFKRFCEEERSSKYKNYNIKFLRRLDRNDA